MKSPTLERTNAGWTFRLRCGVGRQFRLAIPMEDEAVARVRAERLSGLARELVSAGRTAEAPTILRKGAGQVTDAGYSEVEAFARKLCKEPLPVAAAPVTFRQLGEQWTSGELHKRYPDHVKLKLSVESDRGRLARLYETIGSVPLASFALADAERAMSALPNGRRAATRRHYAQLIAKLLNLAVYPLRLLERSPLPRGFLPRIGQRPAFAYLYPSEDAQLMACREIPVALRVLYGVLAREGMRLGEALALRWRYIDLERGTLRLEHTKTGDSRAWALDPGVTAALAVFRGDADDDALVFAGALRTAPDKAADAFREDLQVAKVKRSELYERTEVRRPIRIHDLRATFITLALAGGRSETWVQDRTGHTTSTMLNLYRRQARHASELDLGPLKPLNTTIPELGAAAPRVSQRVSHGPTTPNPPLADSPMIPVVAPAGLEPASPCGRGILKPASGIPVDKNSTFPAAACAPGCTSERRDSPSDSGSRGPETTEHDVVELALARALQVATTAGQWQVVAQLAKELEARRLARQAPEVASLDAARAKRNGGGK